MPRPPHLTCVRGPRGRAGLRPAQPLLGSVVPGTVVRVVVVHVSSFTSLRRGGGTQSTAPSPRTGSGSGSRRLGDTAGATGRVPQASRDEPDTSCRPDRPELKSCTTDVVGLQGGLTGGGPTAVTQRPDPATGAVENCLHQPTRSAPGMRSTSRRAPGMWTGSRALTRTTVHNPPARRQGRATSPESALAYRPLGAVGGVPDLHRAHHQRVTYRVRQLERPLPA